MIDGTAAIRSISDTMVERSPAGEYSADVERRQQGQREGDHHRHEGDLEGAGQHRGDADDVGLRLPAGLGEEAPPVAPQRRERLPAEEQADARR